MWKITALKLTVYLALLAWVIGMVVVASSLSPAQAQSRGGLYNMDSMLKQRHPFATRLAADPPRVFIVGRKFPASAFSRSLGDALAKMAGVSPEPELSTHQLTRDDKCMIIASDGVWEFISSQEAVAICQTKHPNATAATKELIKQATARWKAAEGNYRDDISAIVVSTPDRPPYSLYPVLHPLLCGPPCDHAYHPPPTPA